MVITTKKMKIKENKNNKEIMNKYNFEIFLICDTYIEEKKSNLTYFTSWQLAKHWAVVRENPYRLGRATA